MVPLYIRLLTGRFQVRILVAELMSSEPQVSLKGSDDISPLGDLGEQYRGLVALAADAG